MHKYCAATTSAHSVSQQNPECRCCISDIIKTERGQGRLFNCDVVLNLDAIENKHAKRERRDKKKTMDAFWGISENNRDKKIVLVDFKFDVNNPKNLTRLELEGKVKDSMVIIGSEVPICNKYFFVFSRNIQQAKSQISRLFTGKPNNSYQAITEKDLHETYW